MKSRWFGILLAAGLVGLPASSRAQDLVNEALAAFSPQTIRVEFSSPSKLRALPNYASLRQRFEGPRLTKLETALEQLGVRETDIDSLMLGWGTGKSEMDLYGLAAGRFDARTLAASARERGIAPSEVSGQPAYCLEAGLEATCVAVLSPSLGAFGKLTSLTAMLDARSGVGASLNSNAQFKQALDGAKKEAPIWGVAVGTAVGDWFRGYMPNQGNLKLDWAKVFQDVDSLTYSVDPGQTVNLNLDMNCKSNDAAASLNQVLQGLKLAQQLVWENQNPGRPNPFQAMEVKASGREVGLQVTTDYTQLELASGFGARTN